MKQLLKEIRHNPLLWLLAIVFLFPKWMTLNQKPAAMNLNDLKG
jgi:hypothetical protein